MNDCASDVAQSGPLRCTPACHLRPTIQPRLRTTRIFRRSDQTANLSSNRHRRVLAACASPRRSLRDPCVSHPPSLSTWYW
eukprot:6322804-Prymnesium_polylepis.1